MTPPLAFLGPIGPWEFALILLVGLLLFGKDLPEVGRKVGRSIVEFRRSFNQLKRQVTDDPALREARGALDDLRREVERPKHLLRDFRDPVRMFDNLTHQDLATPGPGVGREPQPSGSFLDHGAAPPKDQS